MVSDRASIFPLCIPWGKTFSLVHVPNSRSSSKIKVKYQGHNFHKHTLFGRAEDVYDATKFFTPQNIEQL